MTPSPSARSQGAALRQARHARVRGIRRRVIAGALALFIATWLLITVTLANGNDPALAANAAKAAKAAATSVATTSTSAPAATTSTQTTGTSTQSSGTSTQSSGTSSLTSSQS